MAKNNKALVAYRRGGAKALKKSPLTKQSIYFELRTNHGDHVAREFHLIYTHGPRVTLEKARKLALQYARECAKAAPGVM